MPEYERITADDVQISDRIARSKTHHFTKVVAINEGDIARRFACVYVQPDVPDWLKNAKPDHQLDAGNIRPRRTAKLWRLVVS